MREVLWSVVELPLEGGTPRALTLLGLGLGS